MPLYLDLRPEQLRRLHRPGRYDRTPLAVLDRIAPVEAAAAATAAHLRLVAVTRSPLDPPPRGADPAAAGALARPSPAGDRVDDRISAPAAGSRS
jgi:hypothetical protein